MIKINFSKNEGYIYIENLLRSKMFGNMMEQLGLPQPIQVEPYEQRYSESFLYAFNF